MALREIPLRRVGNRTSLFMGGDREMVMVAGLLAFALIVAAQEIKAAVLGTVLWFGSLYLFRLMAKSDPLMRHVYLRHRRYQAFYSPRATPFRENTAAQGKQYQ